MPNEQHLEILKKGVQAWNEWREKNPEIKPDLNQADLAGVNLEGANLGFANLKEAKLISAKLLGANLIGATLDEANLFDAKLSRANLAGASFYETNLKKANLVEVNFSRANLAETNLKRANLTKANFYGANLNKTDFYGATLIDANFEEAELYGSDLTRANLTGANFTGTYLINTQMVETNVDKTYLIDCNIYGISAWGLLGKPQVQTNLIVTPKSEPKITVDNLEVAQFIYLMLHNEKIRDVINTIGKKGVLILGRFTPVERKSILDSIREKLRQLGYVPIVFDFERPTDRDFTETIKTLAGMCRFIIADITNPKSSPLELQATVPDYMIPFVPIFQKGEKPFPMFKDLQVKFRWVLDIIEYSSLSNLMESFEKEIINPALEKHSQLTAEKAQAMRIRHI